MEYDSHQPPPWMSALLIAAGLFSMIWAGTAMLSATAVFAALQMETPAYPAFWYLLAITHFMLGGALLMSATQPHRHWPLVLLALLFKLAEPVVFLHGAVTDALPWSYGWIMVIVNGIWWAPLAMVLMQLRQFRLSQRRRDVVRDELAERRAICRACDQHGVSLAEHSRHRTVLLVVLRQFGCTFCRETLSDLLSQRSLLEARGIRAIVVHMTDDDYARRQLRRYGLDDLPRISDPRRRLHRALGLGRGTFGQVCGPRVVLRGVIATLFEGHGIGRSAGDAMQMPGIFLIDHGNVVTARRHERISDRYDLEQIVCPASDPSLTDLAWE